MDLNVNSALIAHGYMYPYGTDKAASQMPKYFQEISGWMQHSLFKFTTSKNEVIWLVESRFN